MRAVLNDTLVPLCGGHQQLSFPQNMRSGFLDIDMFFCIESADGNRGVPMMLCRHHDDIDRIVIEDAAKIVNLFYFLVVN